MIKAVHDRQLVEHGGAAGTSNWAAVDAALARPRNLATYGDPDAATLAATYAWGIAANHSFVDGNKRTGWVAARLFLADNGYVLVFDQAEAVQIMRQVAGKTTTEEHLADWFRKRLA